MMEKDSGKKILLVEDELFIALDEKLQLESYGYLVIHCDNGDEAIKAALDDEFVIDLILMDIDLGCGKRDGTIIAAEILNKKDIPIVFLSSHTEKEIVDKTEKITSYGYVVKNTGIVILDASIKMAFRLYAEKNNVKSTQSELILLNDKLNLMNQSLYKANEELEAANEELSASNEELIQMNNQLISAENEIAQKKILLSGKIDTMLDPKLKMSEILLENIIDIDAVQGVLNDFCSVTGMVTALLDLDGKILVSTGWQDICTKFHRAHTESALNCTDSDLHLSTSLKQDEFSDYKCKNGLWDVVTPLFIGDKHAGNIFTGQFFYEDDDVDENYFIRQAESFGYDKHKYIEALKQVPVYSKDKIRKLMMFLVSFFKLVARLGFSNILLTKEAAQHLESRDKLIKSEEFIRQQLSEKELILREVHHRIKNNIANVGNLLRLQANAVTNDKTLLILKDAAGRVDSMRYLYEKLMISDDYREISVKTYLDDLIPAIKDNMYNPKGIHIHTTIDDFMLDTKTIFILGTIVNELITNSMKYAFPKICNGNIFLNLDKHNDEIRLTVRDDGVGIPQKRNIDKYSGFGIKLIEMLTKQLDGVLSVKNKNGAEFSIMFRM